jgi:hypothetical protein
MSTTEKQRKTVSNDERIKQLFEIVNQKKAQIAKAERPHFLTNCSFSYVEDSTATGRINLQVLQDLPTFVNILAFLNVKASSYCDAALQLGLNLSDLEFKWQGYKVEDWKKDIQTRIDKIQINQKKSELETLESNLNGLISPEMRASLELERIEKELSK